VAPLTMGWCLDCHRNPIPNLRPRDQVTVMGYKPTPADKAQLATVNPPTNCSTCHR
jgi:hypothetical protein